MTKSSYLSVCTTCFFALALTGFSWAGKANIKPTDFVVKENLEVSPKFPFADKDGAISPLAPTILEPGYLYLRQKNDATSYSWYKGRPSPEKISSLKAFRPLGVPCDSFIYTKFFGSRLAKAYQDESEIYFDRNYLYSTRVPTLYYAENDLWIELVSQKVTLGSLDIASAPLATAVLDGDTLGMTPLLRAGLPTGIHVLKLTAPGYLPIVSGAMVSDAQVNKKEIQLIPIDSLQFQPLLSVSMDTVLDANTLPELEPLWEKLQVNQATYKEFLTKERTRFDSIYPKLMPAPLGAPLGDVGYHRYQDAFLQTRDEAYGIFLSSAVPAGKELESILTVVNSHKDSLEKLLVTEKVYIDTIFRKISGVGQHELQIKLASKDGRINVGWIGTWTDSLVALDTILPALKDTLGWWNLQITYQNKPVRIQKDSTVVRRQYRFAKLVLTGPSQMIELKGKFVLPEFILKQPDVQAWLGIVPIVHKDSAKATVAAPSAIPADDREPWLKAYRGEVVEIPGGLLRYKGKMVELSPYAIQKSEVTQAHYQRIMLENPATRHEAKYIDARKPIHNVTWDEADEFCKTIGGQLPTEAQWENAARAGSSGADFTKATAVAGGAQGPTYVGSSPANAWGLTDVEGNVSEWTNDRDSWFHFFVDSKDPAGAYWPASDRVFKGANWQSEPGDVRLIDKDYEDPRYWSATLGMRCAFPSLQMLKLDSIKTFLKQKDSLAVAKGIVLLGGPLDQLDGIRKIETDVKPVPVSTSVIVVVPAQAVAKTETWAPIVDTKPAPPTAPAVIEAPKPAPPSASTVIEAPKPAVTAPEPAAK